MYDLFSRTQNQLSKSFKLKHWAKACVFWVGLFLSFSLIISFTPSAQAAVISYDKNIPWASRRDLTEQQFTQLANQYKSQNYLMIDMDAYPDGRAIRYSMVLQKNPDGRAWVERHDLTSAQYHQLWTEMQDKGFRPLDISSYRNGNQQLFAGIWVENREGYGWSSRREMTSDQYRTFSTEQQALNYYPIDLEIYPTANGIRYATIWVSNRGNIEWLQRRDLTRDAYQTEVNNLGSQGYSVVDFESYRADNGQQSYAAIFEKRPGFARQVRTERSETGFANLWRQYGDEGYRLVDFERYETPNGTRYGGIWIENASRLRYNRKDQLDSIIEKYRTDNDLPGISVSIVKDGEMIYRRGFGWADKENQKVAHGETIYNAASVSKVIGGTLAVKLQDEGRLRNGQRVTLDLSQPTRSYLANVRQANGATVSLPTSHQHTVEQLFAHLACIQHYGGPSPASGHYVWAIEAASQIWNAPFVENCTAGVNRNYSTHAYTYLAAVLEKVSGRTSAQLVESELAVPYDLPSLRVRWGATRLPSLYDRAVPYSDNGNPSSYQDDSWKVFGGGIEASPVDLAWFGWKVLNGDIVNAAARDNELWTRVNSSSPGAIGWQIPSTASRGGQRVAEHDGSWSGARSYLRVYRDAGLVIAVMSNRRNHAVGDVGSLTTNLATAVLQ